MATISDVARLASVSAMTVSRVLNQSGNVSPQKREAVMQAVAILNYQPNLVARSLATNRSGTIGLLMTEMGNPIYPSYMEGVSESLHKSGLDLILYNASSFHTTLTGINTLLSKQVDGLILLPLEIPADEKTKASFAHTFTSSIRRTKKPLIMIGNSYLEGFPYVAEDYSAGAELAVDHLWQMGHREIGYMQCVKTDYPWNERTAGFIRAMRRLGAPIRPEWCPALPETFDPIIASVGDWVRSMRERRTPLPTAVYCANDLIALSALYAFQQSGLSVPEDISLIGHDGIPYAAYSNPRISTVALVPRETGRAAAQLLVEAMQGKGRKKPATKLMPPRLVEGATVRQRSAT